MNGFRYIKKPVEIEAFQMNLERRWDNSEWPNWLHEAWNVDAGDVGALCIDEEDPERERLVLWTLEGPLHITWGDYIIWGIQGELYPCKPDIFHLTYKPVQ